MRKLSILGVEQIIKISVPVLVFIYPVAISLIILNLSKKYIENDYIYKGVVIFTSLVGLVESLASIGLTTSYTNNILEILPFSSYGLTWLFPGVIGFILFSFFKAKKD